MNRKQNQTGLEELYHRLIESDRDSSVMEMAACMAHDLNNALTLVNISLDNLRVEVTNGHPLRRHLDRIAIGAKRVEAIVQFLESIVQA